MIRGKKSLQNVERLNQHCASRKGKLRLDMNEAVPGLPVDFVNEVLAKLHPEDFAAYPEYEQLYERLSKHVCLDESFICLTNGSDAAIKYLFDAFISAGDQVLMTDPTFAMYPVYCRISGAEMVAVPYGADMQFPYNEFIANLHSGIRMAVVVNPNNPTGSVLEQGQLRQLIRQAAQNGTLMVVDEAYYYYYPHSVISWVREFDNLVVLRTFSKLCAMAGLRIGYLAATPQVVDTVKKVKPTYDVNSIAVAFANNILDRPELIKQMVENQIEGKLYLISRLQESNIPFHQSHANFLLIQVGNRVAELVKNLEKNNIQVSGGFRNRLFEDCLRVTIGDRATMEQFWYVFSAIWHQQGTP